MFITRYALRYPKVIGFFLLLSVVAVSLTNYTMGKKEDAPFVIKTAVINVEYPGATPNQNN